MKDYRAGIYLRLSREHDEENNSIEAQREITTKYAISKGFRIVREYEDNGYSGILDSRPALREMMLDISRGIINMIIVKDLSRLTRNKNKTGWYTEIFFPDNDVRFISVTEFIDSGDRYEIDDSIMLRGIANQYYIADISKKIKANKNVMKESGQFVEYYTPYGYKKADDDIHKVVIDEKVADNIRKIYDMYLNGITSGKIAEYLNQNKIENPSRYMKLKNATKKWSGEQVNDMLNNPFYAGDTIMNKYETNYLTKTCRKNKKKDTWIIKEDTHEPIISKETFKKVQEIKESKKVTNAIRHEYLLRDLVYCGHCQKKFQYKIYKSADKQRFLTDSAGYKCSMFYKKNCNNGAYIREKDINEIVKKEVVKRLSSIEVDKITYKLIDYYKENDSSMQKLKEYRIEKEKLERKKSVLYRKKCEQYITVEEFKIEYAKANEQIQQYETLIKELYKENIDKIDVSKIKDLIQELKNGNQISNEFLKEIICKIKIYSKNRIEIIYNI